MLKLKMMLCVDDVAAGRRRLHIKAVCQSASSSPGVDNAASPDWQTPPNGDYLTLRESMINMQKQLEGNPEVY